MSIDITIAYVGHSIDENASASSAPNPDHEQALAGGLGLTNALWRASQELLLPGGLHAFGQTYFSRAPSYDPVSGKWRESPFLPRKGGFTGKAWQDHLTGKHTVGLVWPGLVNCAELDIDRKRLDVAPWDSVLDRLVRFFRAAGLLAPGPSFEPSIEAEGALATYGEWVDQLACDRRALIEAWNRGELLGILWQSSAGCWRDGVRWPGGARLRIPLDGFYPADVVRDRFAAILDEAFPGRDKEGSEWCVELAPYGQKNWRLPGGRGSDLIRIEDGELLTATSVVIGQRPQWELGDDGERLLSAVKRTDLHRDLGLFVKAWAKAAERVLPLPQKARANRLEGKGTAAASTQATAAPNRRGAWSTTANLPPPVSGPGERNALFGRLLCGWYVGADLAAAEVTTRARAWLDQPGHCGSLGGPNGAAVKRSMIDSIPRALELLDEKVAAGVLKRGLRLGGDGARPLPPSLASLFAGPHSTPSLKSYSPCFLNPDESRKDWRVVALKYVTDDDWTRINALGDDWLRRPKRRPKLAVLVGLIRMMEDLDGPFERVRIPYFVVEQVASMKRLPAAHPMRLDAFGKPRSPYRYLLEQAQAAGFLGQVIVRGKKASNVTIYEVPRGT